MSWVSVGDAEVHPSFVGVDAASDRISEVLDLASARIETVTGVAWVPRTASETLAGDGTRSVWLSRVACRSLTSVTVDGDSVAVSEFTLYPWGQVKRARDVFPAGELVVVEFEHGRDAPPDDLLDAMVRAAATMLQQEDNPRIGERTEQIVAEGATINFAGVPDIKRGRPFGMPDVDAVVMSYASSHGPQVA